VPCRAVKAREPEAGDHQDDARVPGHEPGTQGRLRHCPQCSGCNLWGWAVHHTF
jgi:hypothetical protein